MSQATTVTHGQAVNREQQWPTAAEDPDSRDLAAVAHLDPGAPARRRVRDRIVCEYLPMARRLAGRFSGRGEPLEDLVQVATVGLLNAADRYDASHGVSFAGFAGPTILGELRHYFRDNTWDIRVNRRLQELHLRIRRAAENLVQELGHEASEQEIAARVGMAPGEVREGIAAGAAYRVYSLNAPVSVEDDGVELGDLMGDDDGDLESFADRAALSQVIAELPDDDQALLALRFSGGLSQSEIAGQLGVSQMQVSRLLGRVLGRLREALLADEPAEA